MAVTAQTEEAAPVSAPYFTRYDGRKAPEFAGLSARRRWLWHFLAGASVAAGGLYLYWRWSLSLNAEALVFSALVAGAETLFFLGTLLFYFDIWQEGDTPQAAAPQSRQQAGMIDQDGDITVDVFITTYDEPCAVVAPSIADALGIAVPENTRVMVWLLDDGDRAEMAALAQRFGIGYLARQNNLGFKAGNLRNGLLHTSGDFVVICDADTRLFPTFLQRTLGYFRDPQVAWVQTPHWFYDIPEGQSWPVRLSQFALLSRCPLLAKALSQLLTWCTGSERIGADPFLSDTSIFFDVIQRSRNRNGASFCCGAASIHRREAVFSSAVARKAAQVSEGRWRLTCPTQTALAASPMEPFRFHVSEDLYTSILLHEDRAHRWRSVYHPQVEARMLSPVSLEAWAAQRLKYAGGTFDIALNDNPLFRSGLTWRQKLHYGATFWSYMGIFWAPILLLAPAYSLVTGITPVTAYSMEFFAYFLPAVVLGELAIIAACKGYAVSAGRTLAVAAMPILWHALFCVLRGQKPKFAPTPKLPVAGRGLRFVLPHIALLVLLAICGAVGTWQTLQGAPGFSASLLWVNLFWLGVNMAMLAKLLPAALWRAQGHTTANSSSFQYEVSDASST
jgi:cellulose synthase (UDP-forming)